MKKLAIFALLVLSACGGDVKGELGLRKDGPDEFAVERKPKLEVPPSFKIRPPVEGAEPLNVTSPQKEAKEALFAKPEAETTTTEPSKEAESTESTEGDLKIDLPKLDDISAEPNNSASEGESLFLKKAGALDADTSIRSTLKEESKQEQGTLEKLQSISDDNFQKTLVDPEKEKERIINNKKENKPITEGETPAKSINHDKSVIDKIFN